MAARAPKARVKATAQVRAKAIGIEMRPGSPRRRLRMVFVLSVLALLAVVARVAWLQTVGSDSLVAAGKAQRVSKTVLVAHRGTIFARDGGELALSVPSSSIYADPHFVVDPTLTAAKLVAVLGLSAEQQAKLTESLSSQKRFVYVARQIDDQLADAVMNMKLPGVQRLREDKRIMPSGEVGRSVLGRTVDEKGGMQGITGVEAKYDALLTGIDGEQVRERDRNGNSIPGADSTTLDPVPGDDLVLTIDRSLQFEVERALTAQVEAVAAKGGTVVVMDTATGELYAVANVERNKEGVVEVTSANLAAVEAFEPGSVAKVFSLAAVVDSDSATPDTSVAVPGFLVFDKGTKWEKTIKDAHPHGPEMMTMRQVLTQSSNIGTYLLAKRLPSFDVLHQYLDGFGFGHRTALDLPGETRGILDEASKWEGTEKATVTYGYHYQASSLQFTAAVNAIANGGVFVEPKLLKSTIGADGRVVESPASESRRVVKATTAATMASMMKDVVCEGTGTAAAMRGMSVAGKTGTAYKVINRTYGEDGARAYRASFAGFFPAEAPRLTVLVTIDEPDPNSEARFGSTAAAPLFKKVATAAIHDLGITPIPGDTGCPAKG